jgi:polysaccharide export outer membrane protein
MTASFRKYSRYARPGSVVLVLFLLGCASDPLSGQRLARFSPRISADERSPWEHLRSPAPPAPGPVSTNSSLAPAPVATNDQIVVVAPPATSRKLKRGDRIIIHKRGIPTAEDIQDVIDDSGNVNLSLIGTVKLAGKTTSEAEALIEKAYVDAQYYDKITIIVVAQSEEYFVRGEVKRPGRYPLAGDVTLLMALATAQGYTDFAKPRDVRIIRGKEVLRFNAQRIEARKDKDPLIEPEDIIVVERAIFGLGPL